MKVTVPSTKNRHPVAACSPGVTQASGAEFSYFTWMNGPSGPEVRRLHAVLDLPWPHIAGGERQGLHRTDKMRDGKSRRGEILKGTGAKLRTERFLSGYRLETLFAGSPAMIFIDWPPAGRLERAVGWRSTGATSVDGGEDEGYFF